MTRFQSFIDDLASVELSARACNQYSRTTGDLRGNAIRRRNLRLYLGQMEAIGPRMLLVGEAVSYRGGRLTGIAFVSESVMLGGVDARNRLVALLGGAKGTLPTGHIKVRGSPMRCVSEGSAGGNRTAAWCMSPDFGDLSCEVISAGGAVRWQRYWGRHEC